MQPLGASRAGLTAALIREESPYLVCIDRRAAWNIERTGVLTGTAASVGDRANGANSRAKRVPSERSLGSCGALDGGNMIG